MQDSVEPAASAFATWRWAANHSNHSGNSVNTSISIVILLVALRRGLRLAGGRSAGGQIEELPVDVDATRGGVDLVDRVCDQRHEQRIAAAGAVNLDRLTGGKLDHPADRAEQALAV